MKQFIVVLAAITIIYAGVVEGWGPVVPVLVGVALGLLWGFDDFKSNSR